MVYDHKNSQRVNMFPPHRVHWYRKTENEPAVPVKTGDHVEIEQTSF
jgi:hypothetical protein